MLVRLALLSLVCLAQPSFTQAACRPGEPALATAREGLAPASVGFEERGGKRVNFTLTRDGRRAEASGCELDALVAELRKAGPRQAFDSAQHHFEVGYGLLTADGQPLFDLASELPSAGPKAALRAFELLSVVGPLVSWREAKSVYEPTRSRISSRWRSVDLRKPNEPASLTPLVDGKALLEELRKDPVVRRLCATAAEAKTFDDLAACARLDAQVFAFAGYDADRGVAGVRLAAWDQSFADLAFDGPTVWVKPKRELRDWLETALHGGGRLLSDAGHEPTWSNKRCDVVVDLAKLGAARGLSVKYAVSADKLSFELTSGGVSLGKGVDCDPVRLLDELRTQMPAKVVEVDGARLELGVGLAQSQPKAKRDGALVMFDLARDLGPRLRDHGPVGLEGALGYEVLARVGPLVTFRRYERRLGDGMSVADESWRAVDARVGPTRLQDQFDEREAVRALKQVRTIWDRCGGLPDAVADLTAAQDHLSVRCAIDVSGAFAVAGFDAKKGRVELRIPIQSPLGLDAFTTTQVALWLTPPKALVNAMEQAAKGAEGAFFLRR